MTEAVIMTLSWSMTPTVTPTQRQGPWHKPDTIMLSVWFNMKNIPSGASNFQKVELRLGLIWPTYRHQLIFLDIWA